MQGTPIEQARKALEACIAALANDDWFGLVAFDNAVETFQRSLVNGDKNNREKARKFLAGIDARGGTELAAGFLAAAKILGGEGGDIVILTDGQVAGTEEILAQARSAGIRLHCLGIGSASQDRFLTLLARETGGVSRFMTPRERVDMAAVDLFASVGRPVAQGVEVSVEGIEGVIITPAPASIVFAGSPVVVYGETGNRANGRLVCRWDNDGRFEMPLELEPTGQAVAVRLLRGARLITDVECRLDTAQTRRATERREAKRIEASLEELSRTYGLSSRRMALVAVVKRKGDRAGELPETRVVPVGMPQDTAFEGYFAGQSAMMAKRVGGRMMLECNLSAPDMLSDKEMAAKPLLFDRLFSLGRARKTEPASVPTEGTPDVLIELARRIEPDGGMPGENSEQRMSATIVALLCFLSDGHTTTTGAFRAHVQRLLAFLKSQTPPGDIAAAVIARVESGKPVQGKWTKSAAEFLAKGKMDDDLLREELSRALSQT
jgi:Ca-activated chloride channel family protein